MLDWLLAGVMTFLLFAFIDYRVQRVEAKYRGQMHLAESLFWIFTLGSLITAGLHRILEMS